MTALGTDRTSSPRRPVAGGAGARGTIAVSVVVGLVFGSLTALGQGYLPDVLASVANSSGSWSVMAFGVAVLAARARWAVIAGGVTLLALLAGYVGTNELRGFSSSFSLLLFWGIAGFTIGPLIGLGAHWLRTRTDTLCCAGG